MKIAVFLFLLLPGILVARQRKQFLLFDVEFRYTKQDADHSTPSQSHFFVSGDMLNPSAPGDWTSPADFRNGYVHIRLEVIEKPAGGYPT